MRIPDFITPATIAVRVRIDNKAHALRFAAASFAERSGFDHERIRQALSAREALGSTGIGSGIAVPHVCLAGLDRTYTLLFTLAAPIEFDSIDNKPVDIIFAIISPGGPGAGAGEVLSCLAAVSRMLRNRDLASALRKANNPWNMYDIIVKSTGAAAQPVN